MIRSIGADHVIDHTRTDFTQRRKRYDLIVDIPGNDPFSRHRRALTRPAFTSSSATTASAPYGGAGSDHHPSSSSWLRSRRSAPAPQADPFNADEHDSLTVLCDSAEVASSSPSSIERSPQRGPRRDPPPRVRIWTRQSRHHDVIAGAYAWGGNNASASSSKRSSRISGWWPRRRSSTASDAQ